MRRFTALYLALDATTSTSEKTALLEGYFRDAPHDDAAWALALLTGNRPKGAPSTRAMREEALRVTNLPEWMLEECHAAVGDLAETIALLLPDPESHADEPLARTMRDRVLPLASADDAGRRAVLREAWRVMDRRERFVFHKIIRGGMRVGVQTRTVVRALAPIAGVHPAEMAHRLTGGIEPSADAFCALLEGPRPDDPDRPFPFFLAHQLDEHPASALGERDRWLAEWKWDGIRCQLLRRDHDTLLWSRGEEDVTHQFPEIAAAAAHLPPGTTLDGELLAWRDDAALPFAHLQKRLNRKAPPTQQLGLFETGLAVFMAYDLLRDAGADMRDRPTSVRRARLEGLLSEHAPDPLIRLSPLLPRGSWDALAALRAESRARGVEGVMLKHADAPYAVGRTKPGDGAWWKWKVDPYALDAVMVYAQPGSGRRATLHTDYTFALWSCDDPERRELVPFAKAYSGLTQREIERVDAWIRRHTTSRAGPVRMVEPELVFEIGFEGIRRSGRHRSGIAVRFPRILRWRTDKPPEEADTMGALESLLAEDSAS